MIQDISDWHEKLFLQARRLLQDGRVCEIVDLKVHIKQDLKAISTSTTFWLTFTTGAELLAKAVAVKHKLFHVKKFEKRPWPEVQDSAARASLEAVRQIRVQARNNVELQALFDKERIDYLWQIHTPTMVNLVEQIAKHFKDNGRLSKAESAQLRDRTRCLTFIRRNVDVHVDLGLHSAGFENDLERVYIPLLETLLGLYK